jgi:hypothetical protein
MADRTTDAIQCFHQMNSELTEEPNAHGEQAKWAIGERLSSHACCVYVINLLQTSSSVALKSWNTSETLQQRLNNTMKPLPNIQLHYLSIRSSYKMYS